jgi:conjugative transfer signal peptidase TraF
VAASEEDFAVTVRVVALLTTLAAATVVLSTLQTKPAVRYIWNASESVPIGLYLIQPTGRLFVTELVAVAPPEPLAAFLADGGYLPRGVPLLKRVLALPGQSVCRDRRTITVDQIWVGETRDHDGRGRLLPIWQGCHVLADGEVFVMNWQSANSLDGRYFGVLPATAVLGRAKPLWTNEEE